VGGNYATFANLNMSFTVDDVDINAQPMRNVTSHDTIDDHGKTIHQYDEYLKYQYYGNVLQTPASSSSDTVTVTNQATGETATIGVKSYVTDSYSPSQLGCTHSCSSSSGSSSSSSSSSSSNCYSVSTCSSYCHSKNGYWYYQSQYYAYCYVVKYASEICVKVQEDGSFNHGDDLCYGETYGSWQPDPSGAGFGGDRDIPPTTVTVRSADDPYIVIYKLTGGDLWFGLTAGQYAIMGIVFIVVGGFFTAMVVGIFALACMFGHCLFFSDRRGSRF